ncbi:MAG: GNAT family N-acetyltransferase [Defluviitaleaceae bacterium]|nr:GNAT family N-acetyltransferase [Defluviitaleaceae bacterium]
MKPEKMTIERAERADLKRILELQYLAYQSEAKLLDNFEIPPLKQTLAEAEQEYLKGHFLKAVDENGNIIGSVRACTEGETTYIGKLIVRPEIQGRGIGTSLMSEIEKECCATRFEIFTSTKSVRTISLYEHLGYVKFKEQEISDKLSLVFLEKFALA